MATVTKASSQSKPYISSVLVRADPSRLREVRNGIEALEFAKIAVAEPTGKMILTLETPTQVALIQGLTDIQLMPGVTSAALCLDNSE